MKEVNLESLQFHLTNRCNLECLFCWKAHDVIQDMQNVSDKKFISLCNDALELDPVEITISGGGEPIIRHELFLKMAEIIKKGDIRGNLITNGTLLNKKISARLAGLNWDEIIFSIQGCDSNTDDMMRGVRGTYRKTLENIETLNNIKEKNNKKLPKTRFQVVLTDSNSSEFSGFLHLANEMNIDIVNFRLVNEKGKILSPEIDEEFISEIKQSEELASEMDIDLRKEFDITTLNNETGNNSFFCEKPFKELVVFADGRVSPCCNLFDLTDGDHLPVVKGKNLKEIWQGEKFESFRRKKPKICSRCF